MRKPKEAPTAPPKFHAITMPELIELWPNSEEGMLCARLAQRHLLTHLVATAAKSSCTPELAQAEAATARALARLVQDFGTLPTTEKPAGKIPMMRPLKRFQTKPPEKTEPEK